MSVKIVLNKLTSMVLVICMLLSLAAPAVGEEPLTQPTEETVYPEGSTVYADGTVMYADGTIAYADGSMVYADGTTVDAYGTTVYPDGTAVYADGKIVYADGTTAYPDGTTVYIDGTVVYANGTIVYADGTTVHADGTTVDANGTTVYPDGTAVYADGRIVYADGTAVSPDGTTVYPDGMTVYPDGTTVYPDGMTVYPDGTTVKADGTTIYPDGTTVNADGSTLYPDGTTAYPDGTIVYADGTTLSHDGSTGDPDGSTDSVPEEEQVPLSDPVISNADVVTENPKETEEIPADPVAPTEPVAETQPAKDGEPADGKEKTESAAEEIETGDAEGTENTETEDTKTEDIETEDTESQDGEETAEPEEETDAETEEDPEKDQDEQKNVIRDVTLSGTLVDSDGYTYEVSVSYPADCGIPAGAQLSVEELIVGTDAYWAYINQSAAELGISPAELSLARAFDISFVDPETGERYQPTKDVRVSILLISTPVNTEEELAVLHFNEAGEVQAMDAALNGEAIEFETGSFSVFTVLSYTVDFHWGDYIWHIEEEESILLSELLEKLGVTEITLDDVIGVSFSNSDYISVERTDSDWLLRPLAPFDTEEMLTLNLRNDRTVEIRVTDEQDEESGDGSEDNPVTVTITGYSNSAEYDGAAHSVEGYDVAISNTDYTEEDFVFSGISTAERTDAGTTCMGLTAEQFTNNNTGFDVTFVVTDGFQTITPAPVTLQARSGYKNADGTQKTLSGYTCSVDGLTFEDVSAEGSGTDAGTYPVTFSGVALNTTKDTSGNYVVTETTDGTLTIATLITRTVDLEGSWATWRVVVNPDSFDLSSGESLILKDTFTDNQSVDYSSVSVSEGSYDYRGNTGTFVIPDGRPVTIQYRTRVMAEPAETVEFGCTAQLLDGNEEFIDEFTTTEIETIYPSASDAATTGGVYQVKIYVYGDTNMQAGLQGAQFILLDANGRPMTYKKGANSGEDIFFVTDENGYATVQLDEETEGVAIQKNTRYYFEMIQAPEGYRIDSTLYSFIIKDYPDYNAYEYYNGDTLKVRLYQETKSLNVSLRFSGNYSLTQEQQNGIDVILQKKNADDGAWEEVERHSYSEFSYGSMSFAAGKSLETGSSYRVIEENQLPWDLSETVIVLSTYYLIIGSEGAQQGRQPQEFTVTDENGNSSFNVIIDNEYEEPKLTITKMDKQTGAVLPGAVFTVRTAVGDADKRTYTTDENGVLEISGGSDFESETLYYIVETEAPNGYLLPTEPEKHYFFFCNDEFLTPTILADLPAGETAVNLSETYENLTIDNQKKQVTIPVMKTWQGNAWPNEVTGVVIGLYRSVGGQDPEPVMNAEEPVTVTLTNAAPYNNRAFVDLPSRDDQGRSITYSIREEHIWSGTEDILSDYVKEYGISDSNVYIVRNKAATTLTVSKEWYDLTGEKVTDAETLSQQPDVMFDVYRSTGKIPEEVRADGVTNEEMAAFISGLTQVRSNLQFGNADGWTRIVDDLDQYDDLDRPYYYFACENVPSFGDETYAVDEENGSVTIMNRVLPQTVSVTVAKAALVNDPRPEAVNTDFSFTLELKKSLHVIRNYTVLNNGTDTLTTDWNGEVTFTLKPDSSTVLTLPVGVTATVTEAVNPEYVASASSDSLTDLDTENGRVFQFEVAEGSDNATVSFINTLRVICKVVDRNGTVTPFESFKRALAYVRENRGSFGETVAVEMLEDYVMPATDIFDVQEGESITLTTASTNAADGFSFHTDRTEDTDTAIVTRGGVSGSMLTNNGTLTLVKIILDGAKDSYTVETDGGLVNSTGVLNLTAESTLRNSAVTGRGGAVFTSGTLNIPGGAITGCSATSGSAVYLSAGTLNMTGGSIQNNSGADDGAVTVESITARINLSGNPIIFDNTNAQGEAANLCLGADSDYVINVVSPGLDADAKIGVTAMETHRELGEQFATAEYEMTDNLDRFINDEYEYHGKLKDGTSTNVVWNGLTLDIVKEVAGSGANVNDTFTIILTSSSIRRSSYIIDGTIDYTVTAARQNVPGSIELRNVKSGNRIRISPLPAGNYTISEAASSYTPSYTGANEELQEALVFHNGVFSLYGDSSILVTNTRNLADVKLTKTLQDKLAGDTAVEIGFTMKLTDSDGTAVANFPFTDEIRTDESGEATITLSPTNTAAAEQSFSAPIGATLCITENDASDYRVTVSARTIPAEGEAAVITDDNSTDNVFAFTVADEGADITFSNVRKMAKIELRKEIVGKVSAEEPASFAIILKQSNDDPAANYVMYEDAEDETRNITTDENGSAEVTLKPSADVSTASVTLTIPEGTKLTVRETEVKKNVNGTERAIYDTACSVNGETAEPGLEATIHSVTESDSSIVFTNTRKTQTITVTNTVAGYSGNVVPFTYTATVTDEAEDDYDANGFTDGMQSFELATGQSKVLTVPYGATLGITEGFIVGYETTVKHGSQTAVVALSDEFTVNENVTVAFTNNQLIGLRLVNNTSSTLENVQVYTAYGTKMYRVNEEQDGQEAVTVTNHWASVSVEAGKTAILEINHQTSVTAEQAYTVKGNGPAEGYYYTIKNEPSFHEFADPAVLRIYDDEAFEVKGKLRYSVSDSTVTFTEEPLVSFDVNGGAWTTEMEGYHDRDGDRKVYQMAVTSGEKVPAPSPAPVYPADGIDFLGWTADKEYAEADHSDGAVDSSKLFDFDNTPVTEPIDLYAVWSRGDSRIVTVKNATADSLNVTVTLTQSGEAVADHQLADDVTTESNGEATFALNVGESKNLTVPDGIKLVLEASGTGCIAYSPNYTDGDSVNQSFTIDPVENDGTVSFIGGNFKITDDEDALLYDSDGKPAVYIELRDAFAAYTGAFYTEAEKQNTAAPAKVKQLVDDYWIDQEVAIAFPANMTMTLTTAGRSDADFPYVGMRERATIYRNLTSANNNCFTLANGNLTLTNIILDGGSEQGVKIAKAKNGGLIFMNNASGVLNIETGTTLRNCTFTAYDTGNQSAGGAISMANGTLNVQAGVFSNLQARRGGAINVTGGTLNITGSAGSIRFENCSTSATGNGDNNGGDGGAIYYSAANAVTIDGGNDKTNPGIIFTGCVAGSNWGSGGAIYAATSSSNNPVTVSGCRFIECSARTTEANNAGNGGGAICANNVSAVYVSGCTFDACDTLSRGGAIVTYVKNGGEVSVAGSSFDNCNCKGQGGALAVYQPGQENASPSNNSNTSKLTVSSCEFQQCSSGTDNGSGDAIQCYLPCVEFTDTSFTDCWAGKEGGAVNNYFANNYGAVWSGTYMTLTRCRFVRCRAEDRYQADQPQHYGGGVNTKVQTVTVTDSYFEDCVSTLREGGALHLGGQGTGSNATVTKSTFKNCMAKAAGGAVLASTATLTVSDSYFYGCVTTGRGEGTNTKNAEDGGGAISHSENRRGGSTQVETKITNCVFSADPEGGDDAQPCSTAIKGGAIWTRAQSVLISGCTIEGSVANGNGGAIYLSKNSSQNATITGGSITNCHATQGSAVYAEHNVTFSGNLSVTSNIVSDINDGAIHGGTLYFEGNVKVHDNTCSADSSFDHDVLMQNNNNTTIYTTANGLGSGANIGVYVVDAQVNGHGLEGKPFGTWVDGGSDLLESFFNDRDSDLYGYQWSATDNKIYWGIYVCKITDAEGNTLKRTNGRDAVYQRLTMALNEFTSVEDENQETGKAVYIKILVEEYHIQQEATITSFPDADITLTTETYTGTDSVTGEYDGKHPYRGTPGTFCTISRDTRYNSNNQLFKLSNANTTFRLENITLDGRKDKTSTQGNYRLIEATAGKVIVNGGTTFQYGYTNNSNGAAVCVSNASGSLEINSTEGEDVLFEHCYAAGSGNGGAIYAVSSLEINSDGKGKTIFSDCSANHGGAIMVNGNSASIHMTIDGSVFRNCHSICEGGAVYHNNNNNTTSSTTLQNCIFENCYSVGNEQWSYGGAVNAKTAYLTVESCSFTGCYARSNGGAINHGSNESDRVKTTITNTAFDGCYTVGTSNNYGSGGSESTWAKDVLVSGSSFRNSTSTNHGGALYCQSNNASSTAAISGTTFENCASTLAGDGCGGAIYSRNKALTLQDYKPDGITTGTKTTINACTAPGYSGAVYMETSGSTLNISDSTKISNCYADQGGAIYLKSGVTMNLTGSPEFTNNGYITQNGSVMNASNGACIYLVQDSRIRISDSPKFSRNILPNQERIVNGGITDYVRQDIYLAGYADDSAMSIYIAGELTGDTIWVWPEQPPHRGPGDQFAKTAESVTEASLQKFRNALSDGDTGCTNGEYLAGVRLGTDTENAYWSKMYNISFRKIDNKAVAVANAEFTLYKDKECTDVVASAESADGETDTNARGELLSKGQTDFVSIPIGAYYMKETVVPESFQENDTVYLVLVGSPMLSPNETSRGIWDDGGPLDGVPNAATQVQNQTVNNGLYYGIFPLDDDGKAVVTRNLARSNVGITNIRNDFEAYFMKHDENGNPLPNAAFTVYAPVLDENDEPRTYSNGYPMMTLWSRDGENYPDPVKSADGTNSYRMLDGTTVPKGLVYFRELPIGTYYLVETSYPDRNGSNRRTVYVESDRVFRLEVFMEGEGENAEAAFSLEEWSPDGSYTDLEKTSDKKYYIVGNSEAVCKLTDANDNLLYVLGLDGETLHPAVYSTLEEGFAAAQSGTLLSAAGVTVADESLNPALKLKALRDFQLTEAIDYSSSRALTFTTAERVAAASDRYVFHTTRTSDTARAEIRRDFSGEALITVADGASLTLRNIKLDGQKSQYSGGAVTVNSGSLTILDNTQLQNFKTENESGGAVLMKSGTSLTIDGGRNRSAVFSGNEAVSANGGALALSGDCSVDIQNAQFTGNGAADGGAIYAVGVTLPITNGVFTSNTASSDGGALMLDGSVAELQTTQFTRNSATDGGAIFVEKTSALTLTRGSIRNNNAAFGSAIYGDSAVNNEEAGARIYIDGGTITGNKASDDDGGAINVGGVNARIYFAGRLFVYENTDSDETRQKNVVLSEDSNGIIRTAEPGLAGGTIGVYVIDKELVDGENLFSKHGQATKPFGTFGDSGRANPDVFINDRNTELRGVGKDEDPETIFWSGAEGSRRVILRKVGNGYASLEGASFMIYTNAACTAVATDAGGERLDGNGYGLVSKASGVFWIGELNYGTYYIKETGAPGGYEKNKDKVFKLIVNEDGFFADESDTEPTNELKNPT